MNSACIPNIVLKAMLTSKTTAFNIHLNACSIFPKINTIRKTVAMLPLNIIAVSETWLTSKHTDQMVSISGYNLIRHDRQRKDVKRGGGVCIYARIGLTLKVLSRSEPTDTLEFLLLQVCIQSQDVLVGFIYNPPQKNNLTNLLDSLDIFSPQYENIILTGDFNINQLVTNRASLELKNSLNSRGLFIVNSEPTHFTPNSNSMSCLDLHVVSDPRKITMYDQVAIPAISNHDLIILSYELPLTQVYTEGWFRDYKAINQENLLRDLVAMPWENLYTLPNPDDQVQFFNMIIIELYNRHVPLKKLKPRTDVPPYSKQLDRACAERDMAHRHWRRTRTQVSWDLFSRLKAKATQQQQIETRAHHSKKFSQHLSNTVMWRNIKQLGLKDKRFPTVQFSSDELNIAFTNCISENEPTIVNNQDVENMQLTNFSLSNTTIDCSLRAINGIKSKAIGVDGIDPKFIKLLLPHILSFIHHIFNTILTTSSYPETWKCAKVIPIPKTPVPKVITDYRPISILPFLSKAFERLISIQLNVHLKENRLLSTHQSGFRKHRSTTLHYSILQKR